MNNEIQIFNYEGVAEVRAVIRDGEPWFVAKDVADILEFSETTAMTRHLDDDEKVTIDPAYLTGSNIKVGSKARMVTLINESGLYSAILRSRKPEAKRFKRWVTHEVLPTIRKTGGYVANDELFIQTYLPNADEATKLLFRTTLHTIRKQDEQISIMKPKAEKYERFLDAEGLATKTAVAKMLSTELGISISAQKLNKQLQEWGILSKKRVDGDFMPNAGYEQYFKVIPRIYYDGKAETYRTKNQIKILPEGVDFILDKFALQKHYSDTFSRKKR